MHSFLLRAAVVGVLTVALMLTALPAFAHVTASTDDATPGAFAVYTVRVPNERDDAGTTQIEVQIPVEFEATRYEPVPGWEITLADNVLTASGGLIAPGQFMEFRFQARNPDEPTELAFPALQTYQDGEVVEWIGPEDAETPASVVAISGDAAAAEADSHAEATAATEPAATDEGGDADESEPIAAVESNPFGLIALIVAVLALLLGAFGVMRRGSPG